MADVGGPSTDGIVEDEEEKYNYYECKYQDTLFSSASISANHFYARV